MVCFCSLGHLQEIRNWINEFTLVIGTYLRATRGLDFLNHNIWVQPKKKKHKMTANVKEKKNWITRKKLCNLISFFFFFWDFKSGFIYEISWRALVILLSFLMQSYDLSDYPLGVGHVLMLLVIELELKKALISYFGGQGVAYLFSPSVLKFLWKIIMIFHHSQKGKDWLCCSISGMKSTLQQLVEIIFKCFI